MHYSKVLTPTQSSEMYEFLGTLNNCYAKAKEAGITPDIGTLINEWRPYRKSMAETLYSRLAYQRKKERNGNKTMQSL